MYVQQVWLQAPNKIHRSEYRERWPARDPIDSSQFAGYVVASTEDVNHIAVHPVPLNCLLQTLHMYAVTALRRRIKAEESYSLL